MLKPSLLLAAFLAVAAWAPHAGATEAVNARGRPSLAARTKPKPLPAGFYVSPLGSDSNLGTLASPFQTLGKCQTAMQNSTIKRCYVRAGTYAPAGTGTNCNGLSSSLVLLVGADDREIWQFYPPDGYLSAMISGGASGSSGVGCGIYSSANYVTINGLWVDSYRSYGIFSAGLSPTIINSKANNITDTSLGGTAGIVTQDAPNGLILHDIVTNTVCHGIASFPQTAGGVNNLLIANSYVYQAATAFADCGGIYLENNHSFATFTQSGELVANNYVQDVNGGGGANCLYVDDVSSAVTLTGNVCRSAGTNGYPCFFIHGGNSNTATGLICDEAVDTNKQILTVQASTATTNNTTAAGNATLHFGSTAGWWAGATVTDVTAPTAISAATTILSVTSTTAVMSANAAGPGVGNGDVIQFTNGTSAPTGNALTASLILANQAGGGVGGGYPCNQANCGTSTIGPNGYQNYTGTSIKATGTAGNDSNPQQQIAPAFTCPWEYKLPSNSPAYATPVFFPVQPAGWGQPGWWGPPGFTIPRIGSSPSPGTGC
jgi:hypothetical protein